MADILNQLQINKTFFIQFALFAAFFFLLSEIYLKPFQKLIQKRNRKLGDEVASSQELLKSVEEKLVEYEKLLAKTRTEARLESERALSDFRAKEDLAVNRVKDELKQDFSKLSQQLETEKKRIETELKQQVTEMADEVSAKILSGN